MNEARIENGIDFLFHFSQKYILCVLTVAIIISMLCWYDVRWCRYVI